MKNGSYRIKDPTVAISDRSGKKTIMTVPAGSVVVVEQPKTDEMEMLDVLWNGRHVLMFARDLRARGEVLPTQAA
jgi:hypothetical protein